MEGVDYVAKNDNGSVFVYLGYWSHPHLQNGWFEEADFSALQGEIQQVYILNTRFLPDDQNPLILWYLPLTLFELAIQPIQRAITGEQKSWLPRAESEARLGEQNARSGGVYLAQEWSQVG